MKKIFIGATRQNDGKTITSIGLAMGFKKLTEKIGFIKPVGQRYVEVDGYKVDEDSVLIEKICGFDCKLKDMSPIAIERGFTEKYIRKPDKGMLIGKIKKSFAKVAEGKDLMIIEGTGHAGVGSVFDMGNATVARLLGSKVVMVTIAGIGRPIDEIMLNKALFEKEGVELIGVIVNKVIPEKLDRIKEVVGMALKRKGIDLLGVIPYRRRLTWPTVGQVLENLNARLINGEASLSNQVENIIIGAMTPHQALDYFSERTLIITPGDREDMILAVISSSAIYQNKKQCFSGMILTGKVIPNKSIMRLISKTDIPVLYVDTDTYTAASRVHDLVVKIRENDKDKIQTAVKLIEENVDINRLYNRLD